VDLGQPALLLFASSVVALPAWRRWASSSLSPAVDEGRLRTCWSVSGRWLGRHRGRWTANLSRDLRTSWPTRRAEAHPRALTRKCGGASPARPSSGIARSRRWPPMSRPLITGGRQTSRLGWWPSPARSPVDWRLVVCAGDPSLRLASTTIHPDRRGRARPMGGRDRRAASATPSSHWGRRDRRRPHQRREFAILWPHGKSPGLAGRRDLLTHLIGAVPPLPWAFAPVRTICRPKTDKQPHGSASGPGRSPDLRPLAASAPSPVSVRSGPV
jgi:hypothetical protein